MVKTHRNQEPRRPFTGPELLTLRALQIMQIADVIVHDRLVSEEVLSRARRDAEFISVGKMPGGESSKQEDINAMLVRLVASGKRVCRLGSPHTGGLPRFDVEMRSWTTTGTWEARRYIRKDRHNPTPNRAGLTQ